MYDGVNNTGNGHNSSSTTWKNIKDNTNATLHNNTWGNDYLSFNGSSSYVSSSSSYYSNTITYEVTFSLNSLNGRQDLIGNSSDDYGGLLVFIAPNSGVSNICMAAYADSNWHPYCTNVPITANTIYHVTVTYDEEYIRIYINDEFIDDLWINETIEEPYSQAWMNLGCYIMNGVCSNYNLDGKIYSARVYNRALSESDIHHNYLVDSVYRGEYVNLHPQVTISGGSSNVGIYGYEYSISANAWNTYNSSNKPTIEGPTVLSARILNVNHSPGPMGTKTIYIDSDPPTATVTASVSSGTLTVSVSASDPLSGVKEYGFLLTQNSTCNSTLTGFATQSSNTHSFSNFNTTMNYACVKVTDNANNSAYISESIPYGFSVGDEIEIKGEKFYVVSSDDTTTVLLAKYNLLVGDIFDYDGNYTYVKTLSSSDTGYGLQNSTALGWIPLEQNSSVRFVGLAGFSGLNYWDGGECEYPATGFTCHGTYGLLSEYATNGASYDGNPFPYVYRSNLGNNIAPYNIYNFGYGLAQNNGYTIAYFVEQYKSRLINLGAPSSITARLLSYEEMISLSGNSWIFNTTYWLGSAGADAGSWLVRSDGLTGTDYPYLADGAGVRPVIEIPTSQCHSIYDIEVENRQNQNSITPGDEVTLGSEHFYVVSSNQNETALLAKYNLLVGDVFDISDQGWGEYYTYIETLNGNTPGYGLQSSTAIGEIPLGTAPSTIRAIGTVAIGGTNYWDARECGIYSGAYDCVGEGGLLPEYSQNGEKYYKSPYPYVYRSNIGNNIAPSVDYASGFGTGFGVLNNNGHTIAYFVEAYVNTLKTMGAPSTTTGRLLKVEETINLGCTLTNGPWETNWCSSVDDENNPTDANAPSWLYSTTYWLGSVISESSGFAIWSGGTLETDLTMIEGTQGVRPVIVVPTSAIN